MRRHELERYDRMRAQGDLFADTRFFVLLSSLITGFQLAKITPNGLAVLCVLRTFANHRTGESSVPVRTLERYTGLSRNTVLKGLRLLQEQGLVTKTVDQQRNRETYRISDRVPVTDAENRTVGEVVVPYKPQKTGDLLEDLREFLRSGEVSAAATSKGLVFNVSINVQNTTIHHAENVKIGGTDVSGLEDLERALPADHPFKGLLKRLREKSTEGD